MAKLIPIILRLDTTDPNKKLDALEGRIRGLDRLNGLAAKQFAQSGGGKNFEYYQMRDFVRLSQESNRIAEINARTQAKLAQETARQISQAKQSELRQFENAEKSKQRIAEISAREQAKQAEIAAKAIESAKRREFAEYQRIEREKARGTNSNPNYSAGLVATAISTVPVAAAFYSVLKIGRNIKPQ